MGVYISGILQFSGYGFGIWAPTHLTGSLQAGNTGFGLPILDLAPHIYSLRVYSRGVLKKQHENHYNLKVVKGKNK